MLTWALKYLREGFIPIPLKAGTKDQPLVDWKEFQIRKPTETEIQTWWSKWPNANIAGVTGKLADKVVVDVEYEGLKEARSKQWHSPLTVRTGKGLHFWMKYPEQGIRNKAAFKSIKGLDIRGDGGYVLLPPSLHPSGKRYKWERRVFNAKLPDVPTEFLTESAEPHKAKPEGWIAEALNRMTIGNIDDTLTSICGRLRRDGYSIADTRTLLAPHAERAGATEGHLEEKIRNIWNRYEPAKERTPMLSGMQCGNSLVIHSPDNDDSFNRFTVSLDTGKNPNEGTKTGFPTLDKMFEGDLKSERPFVIAARTNVGKTNFAIALSANLCRQGQKVLYFSTEFRYEKIWGRYISVLHKSENFRTHSFFVCDGFTPNIEQVERAIQQVKPDVFIFDFIQHIGKEKEVLTNFMKGCQFLQRKYNSQAIILAQLNRNADWVENGKRIEPRMSMIEGSATIEQAASRVLLLTEVRSTPEMNEVLGVLDKNDTGDKGLINFALMKNPYIFKELL